MQYALIRHVLSQSQNFRQSPFFLFTEANIRQRPTFLSIYTSTLTVALYSVISKSEFSTGAILFLTEANIRQRHTIAHICTKHVLFQSQNFDRGEFFSLVQYRGEFPTATHNRKYLCLHALTLHANTGSLLQYIESERHAHHFRHRLTIAIFFLDIYTHTLPIFDTGSLLQHRERPPPTFLRSLTIAMFKYKCI